MCGSVSKRSQRGGLENRLGESPRGFESLHFRQAESRLNTRLYFCLKGVAAIIVKTKKAKVKYSEHYLTQKRDRHGNFTK